MPSTWRTGLGIAFLLGGTITACDSDSSKSSSNTSEETSSSSEGRAPSSAELSQLAQTLFKNSEFGGATFTVEVSSDAAAATTTITGEVNWKNEVDVEGHGTVTFEFSGDQPDEAREVWWKGGEQPTVILSTSAEERVQRRAQGLPEFPYLRQVPDAVNVPFHQVLQFINGGASPRAENPTLLQQNGSVTVLGDFEVDGHACTEFRFGSNTTYKVGKEDGVLYQFVGVTRSIGTVTVTYANHGPQQVTFPPDDQIGALS